MGISRLIPTEIVGEDSPDGPSMADGDPGDPGDPEKLVKQKNMVPW